MTTTASEPTPAPTPGPAPTSAPVAGTGSWSYGAVWRALPRGLGYLVPTFLIAIVVSTVLTSLVSTGLSLLIFVVGLFLLGATLYLARFAGTFEVRRLRAGGERPIVEPNWRIPAGLSWWRVVLYPLANGRYWLSLLHGAIIAPIVATLTFVFVVLGVTLIATAAFVPFAWIFDLDSGTPLGSFDTEEWQASVSVGLIVLGVFSLVILPYFVRASVWLHSALARPFLGRFSNAQLEQQVSSLFASRSAAVAAEGSALRRIERDIHDGPQQRLIRLQMDLSAAERRLESNPDEAAALIQDARRQAQDALDELRNLSRGFAPPLLLDRGLFAALESLATRSSVPVTLESELGASANLPDEVARNAYFVASELIANASKHSQATAISLSVTKAGEVLIVAVTDDGIGGAVEKAGHGLVGLRDRAAGLGGTFELSSPDGGPTVVSVRLPIVGVTSPAADTATPSLTEPSA